MAWTLDYLELATHHGSTDGAHSLLVLPASSRHYVHPALGWAIATWLVLTAAVLLLPAPRPLPRWIGLPYRVVAGAVVLELALSLCSQWISDYRILLSAGTFAKRLACYLFPNCGPPAACWPKREPLTSRCGRWLDGKPAGRCARVVRERGGRMAALSEGLMGANADPQAPAAARDQLFAELQPIRLANCEFQRFGEPNDGGYLLCANLLGSVQSGYSYGISGYDQWGCDVSHRLAVPVHEYDCFNLQQPACPGGRTVFHGECVGGERATIDGRPFDTLENQFAKNGDGADGLSSRWTSKERNGTRCCGLQTPFSSGSIS